MGCIYVHTATEHCHISFSNECNTSEVKTFKDLNYVLKYMQYIYGINKDNIFADYFKQPNFEH